MKPRSAAAIFASTALALIVGTSGHAQEKVTYQLDWLPGGDKAPIYVCINKGYCKDAGLDVTIASGRGSTEAITRLGTGASDIGSAGLGALLAAQATEKVQVTGVMSIFNKGPDAFYTLKTSGVTKLADVKGKRIATSPFTASNVFLPLVLKQVGISEADIKLTKADPGALGPMLMTGNTDVIIAWMTDVSRYTEQAKSAGKEIVILPWETVGFDLYSASLIASNKFLRERPDVARRFVEAFRKSMEFARDKPDDASAAVVAIVPELSLQNVKGQLGDAMVLMFNDITEKDGLGAFEPSRLASTWKWVAQSQSLNLPSIDPEKSVTRNFIPAAAK